MLGGTDCFAGDNFDLVRWDASVVRDSGYSIGKTDAHGSGSQMWIDSNMNRQRQQQGHGRPVGTKARTLLRWRVERSNKSKGEKVRPRNEATSYDASPTRISIGSMVPLTSSSDLVVDQVLVE